MKSSVKGCATEIPPPPARPLFPFIIVETLVLFTISYWEKLTLFLPRMMLGM
jgi:TRAP-type C4-dicarboxylate transport system permease large subunit